MVAFVDNCDFNATSTGTVDFVVTTAVTGHQTPASAAAIDATVYRYYARSSDQSQWEVGYGAYTVSSTTLARTTVLYNSSGTTSKISFSTVPLVAIVSLKEDMLSFNDAGMANGVLTPTVGSSALTVAIKTLAGNDPSTTDPVYVKFSNVTAATGDTTVLILTAATSLVISSGSAMGVTANTTAFRLWFVGFNDAATFRLGAINCLSGTNIYPLAGFGIASSTAEGGAGAADSAQVFYTGTAVTSKAYSVLGYMVWETGLAAFGTWGATPTRNRPYRLGVPLPGQEINRTFSSTGAVASGSTTVPLDDTIPQNTEGDQYMSVSITPDSAANVLCVNAMAILATSQAGASRMVAFLVRDSTASAKAVNLISMAGSASEVGCALYWEELSNTTSSTAFKVRAGAGAGTTTFNGAGAAREFGGALNSYIKISELMA